MKKLVITMGAALVAATAFAGSADARPGKGHAYGHYKHHKAYRYAAPYRGYYAAPRYTYRRSNAAVAAGVTGAIVGGILSATSRPSYRYYDRPSYGYYGAPRRYYREEYYGY
ncbi:hypothetical protein [Microvirga sp. 2TAF3]|uniref:hypothetical protein n=1 Tax=Microvirga sp. 2TAF3 TaxID=3233014 RepID=UPI003F9814E4